MSDNQKIPDTSPEESFAGLDSGDAPSNQEAVPVPVIIGRRQVPVHWITPIHNLRTKQQTESAK